MTKQGFTEPALNEFGGDLSREWYVAFRYTCPTCQLRKQYQFRFGINYLKTVPERRTEGKIVERLLKRQLSSGWNPHHEKAEEFAKRQVISNPTAYAGSLAKMPFNEAIGFALEQKKATLAKKSYACFSTCIKFAQRAARHLNFEAMPIEDTKRRHVKELLAQMVIDRQHDYDKEKKGRKVTGNFYNKYKCYLSILFSELEEFEAVEYNPFAKIKDRPEIKTNKHRHATEAEKQKIKKYLKAKYPAFYDFLDVEFQTGIRPNEIFSIRIADIDFEAAVITIRPTEGGSKTRKERRVPIPDVLMPMLKRRQLDRYPSSHYVFSDNYAPGENRRYGFYSSHTWATFVKKHLGLEVTLYAFKGMGGDAKREAGISLQAVSSQYGHSKLSTTMIYTHGEKERMEEELRRKTKPL